jgi:hypothetical protein
MPFCLYCTAGHEYTCLTRTRDNAMVLTIKRTTEERT